MGKILILVLKLCFFENLYKVYMGSGIP